MAYISSYRKAAAEDPARAAEYTRKAEIDEEVERERQSKAISQTQETADAAILDTQAKADAAKVNLQAEADREKTAIADGTTSLKSNSILDQILGR